MNDWRKGGRAHNIGGPPIPFYNYHVVLHYYTTSAIGETVHGDKTGAQSQ